ncbi:MAG TPA: branched-chain amino acid ABC transporter permease [Kofleriaceae bacterium]
MTTFLQLCASGLALGAAYALVALGFVVIYRASHVFNFAQGDLLAFGAMLMTTLAGTGMPWPLALALTMIGSGLVGAIIERVALRPLLGRPVFVTIILTIFIGLLLRAAVVILWGPDPRGMPTPWDRTGTISLLGASVLWSSVGAVVAGGAALGLFFIVIKHTRLGLAMRAAANDQEVALALGIRVGYVFGATWFLSAACAALAGVFLAMFPASAEPNLGFVALRAFPAVIVGGLESPAGAVLAGLALGLLEVLAQGYVSPQLGNFGHGFHTVFPYLVMIVFLMVRPYGILGRKEVERL